MVGTANFQNLKIADVIEDSFEKCGIFPYDLDNNKLVSAIRSLNLILTEWANRGILQFTEKEEVISLIPGKPSYKLSPRTFDVLDVTVAQLTRQLGGTAFSSAGGNASNAFDGDGETECTQTSANGYISYEYPSVKAIKYIGVQASLESNYTIAFEWSGDNVNWITLNTPTTLTYPQDLPVWYTVEVPNFARYWRIRETGGATLNIEEIYFDTYEGSRIIEGISHYSYMALADKNEFGNPSLYKLEKQNPQNITLYPVPDGTEGYNHLIMRTQQFGIDIADLPNPMPVPRRFFPALVAALAADMALAYAPDRYSVLSQNSRLLYQEAAMEDAASTPMYISVDPRGAG